MFSNRVLVVCCVVAFACWCAPARADDKNAKPVVEQAPKKPTAFPIYAFDSTGATTLAKLSDAKDTDAVLMLFALKVRKSEEVAETIRTLVSARVQIVTLKELNQLLVCGRWDAVSLVAKIVDDQDRPLFPAPPRLVPAGPEPNQEPLNPLALLGLKTAPEKAPKVPAVIPVSKALDLDEVTKTLRKLFPVGTVIVPLPDEHALLVYVTEAEAKEIRQLANPPVEKAPAPQPMLPPMLPPLVGPKPGSKPEVTKYTVHFKDAKWDDVLDWYAKESGLTLITTVKPTGTFTFVPPKPGQQYTLAEITDILNEGMQQQKFILIRRTLTFFIHPADEKLDPRDVARITLDELPNRGRHEVVSVVIPVDNLVVDDGLVAEVKKLLSPFGTIVSLKKHLLIQDTAGNVARIQKTLDDLVAAEEKKVAKPALKKFTFNMKDATWDEVFAEYAKLTDLKPFVNSKPKGTFTFTPLKSGQQFALAEITDFINDALLAKNHLLIRRQMTFVVVAADEKIDPTLVPRITLAELPERGRTELVQVIIPVEGPLADDLLPELKKVLGPFGSASVPRFNAVVVSDTVGNIAKIKAKIDELSEPKKGKK